MSRILTPGARASLDIGLIYSLSKEDIDTWVRGLVWNITNPPCVSDPPLNCFDIYLIILLHRILDKKKIVCVLFVFACNVEGNPPGFQNGVDWRLLVKLHIPNIAKLLDNSIIFFALLFSSSVSKYICIYFFTIEIFLN